MNGALYKNLPETPGVYLMKGAREKVLYIGKAGNLRRRVSSYFPRPSVALAKEGKAHDSKTEKLLSEIKKVDFIETETALEALILESQLIKKYEPPYNIKEKDDKSFLYVLITKEKFPRVLLVRGKGLPAVALAKAGPFTLASNIREAMKIIRRIFPYIIHPPKRLSQFKRPCLDYELGLCPGTCVKAIKRTEYLKNIRNIKLFLSGKKKQILKKLEKEMKSASRRMEFEKAEKLRRQIFALKHIRDTALITDEKFQFVESQYQRIEAYDVSNISGTSAVGSMAVFLNERPSKNDYRKFRIRTVTKSDDIAMLEEVLRRRFSHSWPYPEIILIDGGRAQVKAARAVINEFGLSLPILGIAKGPRRKKNELVGALPRGIKKSTLVLIRDEAHRFALSYHRQLRSAKFIKS